MNNKMVRISILIALVVALFQTGARAQVGTPASIVPAAAKNPAARPAFAPKLPLFFEKNEGQADQRAGFLARMPNATLYLTGADAVLVHSAKAKDTASALRMHWAGASTTAVPTGDAEMTAKSNYIIGKDESKWHTGVTNFQRVKDSGLYPGVDLVYYGNQQQLEYDLTVQPGASASNIRLQIEGANKISLDKATGDLVVVDAVGSPLRLLKPVVYQIGENQQKTAVAGAYALSAHNTVSFVLGDYDHSRALVIDPQVVYSTVFGGTQTPSSGFQPNDNWEGFAVDPNGFVYILGITTTINLPTTLGSFQGACTTVVEGNQSGCSNFFVAKFDPTQSGTASLVYSTYIGGSTVSVGRFNSGNVPTTANDLAVDASGDVYFAGETINPDWPTTSNAYAPACDLTGAPNGSVCPAGFLTKLDPTGSKLLYSTYLAPYLFQIGLGEPGTITVDGSQVAYIAGLDNPYYLAAFATTKSGNASLVYFTNLDVLPTAIVADPSGNVYMAGNSFANSGNGANGTQFITLNGAQTTAASTTGILIRFNPAGQNTYATLFGNAGSTLGAVSVDPDGTAYVAGDAGGLTVVNGLPSGTGAIAGAFVAKFNTNVTGPASLLYSTYINGADTESFAYSISSNGSGQFAFGGEAISTANYPLINPITQPLAVPTALPHPAFVGIIDPSKAGQSALIFLSFLDGAANSYGLSLGAIPTYAINPPAPQLQARPNAQANFTNTANLYVSGQGTTPTTFSPFLGVPASYLTALTPSNTVNPLYFYAIALGPVECLALSPSPFSLTFPSQELNTTSPPLSFTVNNSCSTAIPFDSVTASSQFNETDTCMPSLPGGQSCTVQVTFEPSALSTSASPTTGTVNVNVTGANAPMTETLSGIGVSTTTATGFLSPPNIAFPPQPEGTVSAPVTVTFTNTGSKALSNGGSKLITQNTGAAAVAFPLNTSIPNGCATTLAVGASCQFQVVFAPTTTTANFISGNSYSQTLAVSGPSPALTMTLTGTFTPPAPIASLSSTLLTFPSTPLNTPNGPQTVTLTNTGSAPLTSIVVGALAGANASSYGLGSGGCATVGTLAAGANCTIMVTFTPQSTGTLTAMFTITDNATPGAQNVFLTGTEASATQITPTITWATPAAITYGTALSATQLDAIPSVPGTLTYTPLLGTVLNAGVQTLSVSFVPNDTTTYASVPLTTVQLTVNQATPTITWATPAAIPYGTALSATQLNATSSVPGTLTFTPLLGTVLTAGVHTLSVGFIPNDTNNYTSVPVTTVQLTVNQVTPTITWATPAAIPYGTALSTTQLNATSSVPGTLTYTPPLGTVLNAGGHTLSVSFIPNDTNNYASVPVTTVQLTVNQLTPTISWATPAAVSYGTALSATQLNATANVTGTFSYGPASGVLTAGSHTLSALFTPMDTTNYTTNAAQVNLLVNRATLTVSANSTSRAVGAANPAFTASYNGFVNGDSTAVLSGSPALSTSATTSSPAGTYPITAAQGSLTAANYTFAFFNGTLSVVTAPTIILTTTATLTAVTNGYQATITVANSGTGPASNVTLTSATLGSATGSPAPQNVGTIAAGSSRSVTVTFPASAGTAGTAVPEKYAGTYTGGSFAGSVRAATLP